MFIAGTFSFLFDVDKSFYYCEQYIPCIVPNRSVKLLWVGVASFSFCYRIMVLIIHHLCMSIFPTINVLRNVCSYDIWTLVETNYDITTSPSHNVIQHLKYLTTLNMALNDNSGSGLNLGELFQTLESVQELSIELRREYLGAILRGLNWIWFRFILHTEIIYNDPQSYQRVMCHTV